MFRLFAVSLAIAMAGNAQDARIRESLTRSVALIQKTQAQWKIPCISCHHQGLGMQALEAARLHGIPVDEKAAQAHSAKVFGQMRGYEGLVESGGIDVFGHGYAVLAVHAAHLDPNISTAIVAKRFSNLQNPDGHWQGIDARPPHSDSQFTATAIGTRVVGLYLPQQLGAERAQRIARARDWLLRHEPHSTEDASYRLLGLVWAGAPDAERRSAATDLLRKQRADGGWSQVPQMQSDAYSTGQAVYALRQSGVVDPDDPRYRKGIRFLLDTQQPEGSWLVKTRLHSPSQISPPFFDAGFPNGKDQFISFAGTCWAVMGLAGALAEAAHPATPLPVPEVQPQAVDRWVNVALFGSADELKVMLDSGLDPNTATKNGVTLLMMAAPDVDKMKLLIDRGAQVNAATQGGTTALLVAASYRASVPGVRLLLEKGAAVLPDLSKPENTPLGPAVLTGDTELANLLLDHGAVKGPLPPGILDNAIQSDDVAMVRLLVKRAGANVNQVNNDMTPLIASALFHYTDMVRALLELGADPNFVDKAGYTALQHTADIWYTDPTTAGVLKQANASHMTALR